VPVAHACEPSYARGRGQRRWGFFSSVIISVFVFVFETRSHYVAQSGLELSTLLLQPPKC
jgi:hypothetical protein